jgi:hypothetical protein
LRVGAAARPRGDPGERAGPVLDAAKVILAGLRIRLRTVDRCRVQAFHCSDIVGSGGPDRGPPERVQQQTSCFSSPSARGTWSFLDRRNPPRKCRLKECSPGETWYTLICLGEMAPTFEPSRKTLTTPPSRSRGSGVGPGPGRAGMRPGPRPGSETRAKFDSEFATIGWSLQPRHPCAARCLRPWVAATTSDLSRSWLIVLFYTIGV